jgi:lysophospholipase L1-like esterase
MRRERVFLLVAIALPIALFGAVEAAVRILWDEGASPVFITETSRMGVDYLRVNPRLAARWFPGEDRPPSPSPELMLLEKPAHGFRVFVLGESAAQGFPYPRTGAFSRALAPILRDALSGDTVEVINLGIAATNSYAMLDIAGELLEHAPDAILYYGGHNEYYGAFGAGSSVGVPGSVGFVRLFLRLQRWRTVRLANHLVARARRPAARDDAAEASFMGAVARDRAIALDGRVYRRGVAQYEGNLARIVRRFRAAGVPVYLASVASNERDQRPFASPLNGAADSAFAEAHTHLAGHDTVRARAAFARARDLDVIRFRAPAAFAEIARRVAAAEGATYVPVAEAFAAESPGGSPGRELFLEHVHPNVEGSWLIARTFFDRMRAEPPAPRRLDVVTAGAEVRYREGRGLTPFDDRVVAHRLAALTARWPFVPADSQGDYFGMYRPLDGYDSLAFLVAAGAKPWEMAKLEVSRWLESRGEIDAALANLRSLVLDSPEQGVPWRASGELLVRAGRYAAAESSLAVAMRIEPTAGVAFARARIAAQERRWADAVRFLEFVVRQQPNDPEVLYRLSLASALAGDTSAARATAVRLARVVGTTGSNPAYREWVRLILSVP